MRKYEAMYFKGISLNNCGLRFKILSNRIVGESVSKSISRATCKASCSSKKRI
jgi:hypothetical protein